MMKEGDISVGTVTARGKSLAIQTLRRAGYGRNKETQTIFYYHVYVCLFVQLLRIQVHHHLLEIKEEEASSFAAFSEKRRQ